MPETKLDFDGWLSRRKAIEATQEEDEFGQRFFAALEAEADVEKTGWAAELAERVAARVQESDPPAMHKRPVVYWSKHRTAFAVPGRNIYLSRRLLEEALPEDAIAFAFAHELAHSRLGHVKQVLPTLKSTGGELVTFAAQVAAHVFRSSEQEADADAWAFSRCRDVGYDPRACLRLFDLLGNIAADYRDGEMAYGRGDAEKLAGQELERDRQSAWEKTFAGIIGRVEKVRWEILRGYPSIRERRERLEAILARDSKGKGR
jgi:Zn-dependent protease with chaperone function